MVLISGKPKAKVFCDAQNIAATVSPREKLRTFSEKNLNKKASDAKCTIGKSVKRTRLWAKSRPKPLEKALQKAFQAIPSKIV